MQKQALTLLAFFFLSFSLSAQNIHFPDKKLKKALCAHYPEVDTNFDGEITEKEAMEFTEELDLSDKGITDLTGLEYFVFLKEIDISYNPLGDEGFATLDRDDPFAFTPETIWAVDCGLTEVDLTSRTFWFLSNIVFDDNENLRRIEFPNPETAEEWEMISLMNCTKLVSLNIAHLQSDKLMMVDLNGCTNLRCVNVQDVRYVKKNKNDIFFVDKGAKVEFTDSPCY